MLETRTRNSSDESDDEPLASKILRTDVT